MGQETADSGSPEVIVLPAIPWLRDGTDYDIYLESAIAHLKGQEIPSGVEMLPLFTTSTVDDDVEIPKKYNYAVLVPKLNEIVAALPCLNMMLTWHQEFHPLIRLGNIQQRLDMFRHHLQFTPNRSHISDPTKWRNYATWS